MDKDKNVELNESVINCNALNWSLVAAKDIIEFNPQEKLAKNILTKKVAMEQLQPFSKDIKGYAIEQFKGGAKFRNGDTLMARITPCLENGKTAQINILNDGEVGFGSTEFIVLRSKPEISDKDYIYYLNILQSAALRMESLLGCYAKGDPGESPVWCVLFRGRNYFIQPRLMPIKT